MRGHGVSNATPKISAMIAGTPSPTEKQSEVAETESGDEDSFMDLEGLEMENSEDPEGRNRFLRSRRIEGASKGLKKTNER